MINEQTIISSFDDKGTLLKWLKAVENALEKASATEFLISKKGNSTLSFILKFADDTQLESGDITLEQGESVESASIVNGHLLLTLTNGEVLDAGNLFNGNVNIDGNFTANSIIENMSGYSYSKAATENVTFDEQYVGAVKNGNKLTLVIFTEITKTATQNDYTNIGEITLPSSVASQIVPYTQSISNNVVECKQIQAALSTSLTTFVNMDLLVRKVGNTILFSIRPNNLVADSKYLARIEITFLLSDNLASE